MPELRLGGPEDSKIRTAAVVETLRFLAGGRITIEDGIWLGQVVEQIERAPSPDDWMICPLCEETTCDSDCPLRSVREGGRS